MPAIYISKYNRFVDNIIGRINRILGKSYDPVRVKLASNETKKNNKTKTSTKKMKKGSKKRSKPDYRNKMGELQLARSTESESREPAFVLISKAGSSDLIKNVSVNTQMLRATRPKQSNKNKNKKKQNTNRPATGNKNKQSTTGTKKTPKARATLFGLSSIKRDGDVTVNMMPDHTTVRTNFIVGPLTLRVEREVSEIRTKFVI